MKKFIFFSLLLLLAFSTKAQVCIPVNDSCSGTTSYCFNCTAGNCGPFELSRGIYRIPFQSGTDIKISNDHFNHCPRGRIDMVGINGGSTYYIAVAADGWIRKIEDDNSVKCDCSVTNCRNNYVWIEHPNGEWTKYTHMVTNSVTSRGFVKDQWVTAGTVLGVEGQVGCASGVHLHFEVAQPIDTNTLVYQEYGGYIDEDWAKNVIPVICSITGNVFVESAEYTAGTCGGCSSGLINTSGVFNAGGYDVDIASTSVSASTLSFKQYSSGLYQAGNYVRFDPGFEVKSGAEFTARVRGCNQSVPQQSDVYAQLMKMTHPPDQFKVYPNPASGQVIAEWYQEESSSTRLFISDMTGRMLMEIVSPQQVKSGKMQVQFSSTHLSTGTYFVHLISGTERHVSKLIVQH